MKKFIATLVAAALCLSLTAQAAFAVGGTAAKIGTVGYGSLRSAVAAVKDGETITIYGNNVEAITVTRQVTFTVSGGETMLCPGEGYLMEANEVENSKTTAIVYSFKVCYTSLTEAVANVKDGETINLYEDNTETVIVTRAVTFIISGGTAIIHPGTGYEMTTTRLGASSTEYSFTSTSATIGHVSSVSVYSDVDPSLWYRAAIEYVTDNGLMSGSGGKFEPNANLTRGMLVTILYRLEGQPKVTGKPFTDVASGQYYADAVTWAAANSIVSGYGNGKFGPNDNITRQELAVILYNYAAYKGYDVSTRGTLSAFPDSSKVASWAENAMGWAVGSGLINGTDGTLSPTGTATRAQVAQILMNFSDKF